MMMHDWGFLDAGLSDKRPQKQVVQSYRLWGSSLGIARGKFTKSLLSIYWT